MTRRYGSCSVRAMKNFFQHLTPPYCTNPKCAWHDPGKCALEGQFTKEGSRKVSRYPYVTKRFACKKCGKQMCDSYFQLFYRDRTEPTYEEIFRSHHNGKSRRAIARDLKCSLDTVQRRFQEMAAQGLLIQSKKCEQVKIRESVAYDGIENFAHSQYDPNNINHVVGRESYFLYDFNYAPLNRKGSMSTRQKLQKRRIENKVGAYPTRAIQECTRKIIMRLIKISAGELLFHSDNHFAYRGAIKELDPGTNISHLITPAKLARNFRNRLFAINHCDLLTRQQLTTFKRETISFSKSSIGMVESFSLFMVWKNFMRTCFIVKHKRDPTSNLQSPAMRVGLEEKVLTFFEFFKTRLQKTQLRLNEDWDRYVDRIEIYDRYTRP
jgi:transposase-like protein